MSRIKSYRPAKDPTKILNSSINQKSLLFDHIINRLYKEPLAEASERVSNLILQLARSKPYYEHGRNYFIFYEGEMYGTRGFDPDRTWESQELDLSEKYEHLLTEVLVFRSNICNEIRDVTHYLQQLMNAVTTQHDLFYLLPTCLHEWLSPISSDAATEPTPAAKEFHMTRRKHGQESRIKERMLENLLFRDM